MRMAILFVLDCYACYQGGKLEDLTLREQGDVVVIRDQATYGMLNSRRDGHLPVVMASRPGNSAHCFCHPDLKSK